MLPFVVTPGDPAGIGPDIVLGAIQQNLPFPLVIVVDRNLLEERAHQLKINLAKLKPAFRVLDVPLTGICNPGQPNPENARYILETLKIAVEGCVNHKFHALITGPVNKAVINQAGVSFSGHTQFLAKLTNTEHTVMMLMTDQLKVALLTDHIPLSQVSKTITKELLFRSIKIIAKDFIQRFAIKDPRILVCGINPHAGEGGHLGHEEQTILIPAIAELQSAGFSILGPVPADTAFLPKHLAKVDVVLAMYHDQGLPVLKFQNFSQGINVTLGLPIIRTSVDHGTAYDLAATGQADPSSLIAAIKFAATMRGGG